MVIARFVVDGYPMPWPRARRRRGGGYYVDDKPRKRDGLSASAHRQRVAWLAKINRPALWPSDDAGAAFALRAAFVFPFPKRWPQAQRANPPQHVARPDVDNLTKQIEDALTGVLWRDDSQVVAVDASKRYGDRPSSTIEVEVLPPCL